MTKLRCVLGVFFALAVSIAFADTPPLSTVRARTEDGNGNPVTAASPLPVAVPNGVQVLNFPSPTPTQSVSVTNFPSPVPTQSVQVVNPITSVSVSNFPSPVPTQTVQVSNPITTVSVSNFPSPTPTQSVMVTNFPSPVPTQPVSGTVWSNVQSGTGESISSTGTYLDVQTHGNNAQETGGNLDAISSHASSIDSKLSTTSYGTKVDVQNSTLPSGAATDATLTSILNAIKAQEAVANSIWTDSSGAFYIRITQVNATTGAVTFSYTTPSGSAATPGAGLMPVSSADMTVSQMAYDATSSGTGYSAGDVLQNIQIIDAAGGSPSIVANFWMDLTKNTTISAPASGTFSQTTQNVAVTSSALPPNASTASAQATGNASLATIASNTAGLAQESGGHLASIDSKTGSRSWNLGYAGDSVTSYQGGTWSLGRTWSLNSTGDSVNVGNFPSSFSLTGALPAFASTPTFNLGTLNGAATAANQTTAISSLSSIQSSVANIPPPGQALAAASMPVVLPSAQITALTPPTTVTANLGTLNGAATASNQSTMITDLLSIISALGSPFQSGGSIGNTSFGISGFLPAFATTPTFNLGTLNGASTSANQSSQLTQETTTATETTAIASSAATIATNTTGLSTAANQSTEIADLAAINTSVQAAQSRKITDGTNTAAVKAASTAPVATDPALVVTMSPNAGMANAANQSTANTSLASIQSNTAALNQPIGSIGSAAPSQATLVGVVKSGNMVGITEGQSTMANSVPVVIASDQSAVATKAPINANGSLSSRQTVSTSESYVAAPSNAVGVIVECESGNSDNLRWGFSNSTASILSSTLGMLCEPGRDTGELKFGAGTYVHLIATGSVSTDYADIQWELSQ